MNELLTLINSDYTVDEIGQEVPTATEREIFCEVKSAGRQEFFAAAQSGIRPEYVFIIWADDYQGEQNCRYCGETFNIYRTYKKDERLELYVKKVTANG